jgi:hypothetical protein
MIYCIYTMYIHSETCLEKPLLCESTLMCQVCNTSQVTCFPQVMHVFLPLYLVNLYNTAGHCFHMLFCSQNHCKFGIDWYVIIAKFALEILEHSIVLSTFSKFGYFHDFLLFTMKQCLHFYFSHRGIDSPIMYYKPI